jgi:dynein heavy chain
MNDDTSMSLILFEDAIFHISRIARSLIFDKGHMLLIGLSGSGKKSMIMLGGALNQSRIETIELRKNYGKL